MTTGATVAADRRTEGLERLDLYRETGIQHLPFNTLYQLLADRPPPGATLLLIPDLICYWLTGAIGAEVTNASTTQLLDVHTRQWHSGVIERLGLDESLLPPLRRAGEPIGFLRQETGLPPTPVIAVGSHDTASAVAGVPAAGPRFGYIACGTWSLVGVELDSPVLNDDARKANFTNEAGVDGKVRFLRNVMGLWLLQECLRQWDVPLDGLLEEAGRLGRGAVIDADDPEFLSPGDMPARIVAACERTGQPVPSSRAAVVRCIVDSLASAHARALADAQRISGVDVDVVHLVGGGARNPLLCKLTADACGVPVEAGPVEATALGNALVQARALGAAPPDLAGMRSLLRATQPIQRYTPSH